MKIFIALALALNSAALFATDQDVKQKAMVCSACHGENGLSTNPLWPNLAGQKAGYIEKQLKAFRDGSRVDPLMSPVSKMLSDAEIQDLAKYFSSLKGAQ